MDEIILVGAGGHARSCIDVIELSGQYKIAGLVEKDHKDEHGNMGYPILGSDDDFRILRQKYNHALVTVGQIKSPETRIKLFQRLQELDYQFPITVSPRAYVSNNALIGDGTIIMHDVIVNSNARIGKNCIINNRALIEHDAVIGDHCHISTGAIINGDVAIGNNNFIGSGVVTKQCISVGNNCVIGVGVILRKDVAENQVIRK